MGDMVDSFDTVKRSEIMRRVRGKDTYPEKVLRKILFALGFRYRLHVKNLPGTPDLVLARYRSAIFINGCFWHWHGCRRSRMPTNNVEYWRTKIDRNRTRDRNNYVSLLANGWRVLVIWECSLKKYSTDDAGRLAAEWLKGESTFCVIEPERDDLSRSPLACKYRSVVD